MCLAYVHNQIHSTKFKFIKLFNRTHTHNTHTHTHNAHTQTTHTHTHTHTHNTHTHTNNTHTKHNVCLLFLQWQLVEYQSTLASPPC